MTVQFQQATLEAQQSQQKFLFFLSTEFSQLSFTAAEETLLRANEVTGRNAFSWRTCGVDGKPVRSSHGTMFHVDQPLDEVKRDVSVFLIGGGRYSSDVSPKLVPWLNRLDRNGCTIGTIGSAAFLLAASGLLRSPKVTLPWECRESFSELYPQFETTDAPYTQSVKRYTSLGGIFTFDLMLSIIAQRVSAEVADEVAWHSNYAHVRRLNRYSSSKRSWRLDIHRESLRKAIDLMEANVENKLTADELASQIGISSRQLQRDCRAELGMTPTLIYRRIQLEKAKCLLLETPLPISEVALASGFSSASHLARHFRSHFGMTAHQFRTL